MMWHGKLHQGEAVGSNRIGSVRQPRSGEMREFYVYNVIQK